MDGRLKEALHVHVVRSVWGPGRTGWPRTWHSVRVVIFPNLPSPHRGARRVLMEQPKQVRRQFGFCLSEDAIRNFR
jgi:hypothetical protein